VSVYVDKPVHRYGRMLMCHMVADDPHELLAMAARIGVDVRWLQHRGTEREHFDVCKSKRALAVRAGAKEVTSRDIVAVIRAKREVRRC
jgi:hypothetical protein